MQTDVIGGHALDMPLFVVPAVRTYSYRYSTVLRIAELQIAESPRIGTRALQAGLQIRAYGRIREFLREFLSKSGGENLSEEEIQSSKS